jgi:hypothetical protein
MYETPGYADHLRDNSVQRKMGIFHRRTILTGLTLSAPTQHRKPPLRLNPLSGVDSAQIYQVFKLVICNQTPRQVISYDLSSTPSIGSKITLLSLNISELIRRTMLLHARLSPGGWQL